VRAMPYYKIIKVINNSAVIAYDQNEEVILLGKGIGFQKKENDIICRSVKIEKKYQLIKVEGHGMGEIDKQMLPFIALVIELMDKSTNKEFSYTTMKSLTEHIAAMYLRIINNENLESPFHYEIKALYAKDYQIGLQIGEEIFKKTGIRIPESELDFLTLYVHNGNNNDTKSRMDLIHSIIYQVSSLLEDRYNIKLYKDSIDYSRFIVHLRFVIERILRRECNPDINLKDLFMDKFKKYQCICQDIVRILENELHTTITDDERVYLMIHIARIKTMNCCNV
jgi:transcriptional antiterminator